MTCGMGFVSRRAKRWGTVCGRKCRRVVEFSGIAIPACAYHVGSVGRELERRKVKWRVRWVGELRKERRKA